MHKERQAESMEDPIASSEELRKEIQEQSQTEAEAILRQAEKEARKIMENAQAEAEKVRSNILKKAEMQAEAVRRRIFSSVHLEIKRKILEDREALLSRLFQKVEDKLNTFRTHRDYVAFLKKLLMEGVLALDAEALRILAGEIEKKLLTRKVLSEIEKELASKKGKTVTLSLSDETLTEGGVVLVSSDGRTKFDNRFSTRMERMKDEMRLFAMKRVIESREDR